MFLKNRNTRKLCVCERARETTTCFLLQHITALHSNESVRNQLFPKYRVVFTSYIIFITKMTQIQKNKFYFLLYLRTRGFFSLFRFFITLEFFNYIIYQWCLIVKICEHKRYYTTVLKRFFFNVIIVSFRGYFKSYIIKYYNLYFLI